MDKDPVIPFENRKTLERKGALITKLQTIAQLALNARLENPLLDGATQASLLMAQDKALQLSKELKNMPLSKMIDGLRQFSVDLVSENLSTYLGVDRLDPLGLNPDDDSEVYNFTSHVE